MIKQFIKIVYSFIVAMTTVSIAAPVVREIDEGTRYEQQQREQVQEKVHTVASARPPIVRTKAAVTITPSGPVASNPYAHL